MKKLYILFIAILISTASFGQTTLTPGDIIIIGLQADTPKTFRFVPLVDLDAGTEIYFTDSGWQGSNFRATEGALLYTAPIAITAGTNILYTGSGGDYGDFVRDNAAGLGSNGVNLSASGDQVIALQGTAASPTFIFAIQSNSTEWQVGSNDANQSDLPTGLTAGETALALGVGSGAESEYDNIYYSGITAGTKAVILAAIAESSNWVGNDSTGTMISSNFTISTASVVENNIEGFAMYPNPVTNGEVRLTSNSNVEKQVEIYSMLGKQVYNKTVKPNETINVSNLNTGMYMMRVVENGKLATRKLVIK